MLSAAALAQTAQNQPSLQIVSPVEGSLISGKVVLRADLDPPAAASSVVFFVDGRQVCTVTAPPLECTWDAGAAVVAHQIRVVANIPGGARIVRTVRTKELGYTEKVDVDVVQVTATVVDSRGHYVKGLPREAFHVFEDDRAQTMTHFAVGRRAARADRRGGHQRQHGAGHAEAEERREGVSRRGAGRAIR